MTKLNQNFEFGCVQFNPGVAHPYVELLSHVLSSSTSNFAAIVLSVPQLTRESSSLRPRSLSFFKFVPETIFSQRVLIRWTHSEGESLLMGGNNNG